MDVGVHVLPDEHRHVEGRSSWRPVAAIIRAIGVVGGRYRLPGTATIAIFHPGPGVKALREQQSSAAHQVGG